MARAEMLETIQGAGKRSVTVTVVRRRGGRDGQPAASPSGPVGPDRRLLPAVDDGREASLPPPSSSR